jgi:hypothetical protein
MNADNDLPSKFNQAVAHTIYPVLIDMGFERCNTKQMRFQICSPKTRHSIELKLLKQNSEEFPFYVSGNIDYRLDAVRDEARRLFPRLRHITQSQWIASAPLQWLLPLTPSGRTRFWNIGSSSDVERIASMVADLCKGRLSNALKDFASSERLCRFARFFDHGNEVVTDTRVFWVYVVTALIINKHEDLALQVFIDHLSDWSEALIVEQIASKLQEMR